MRSNSGRRVDGRWHSLMQVSSKSRVRGSEKVEELRVVPGTTTRKNNVERQICSDCENSTGLQGDRNLGRGDAAAEVLKRRMKGKGDPGVKA